MINFPNFKPKRETHENNDNTRCILGFVLVMDKLRNLEIINTMKGEKMIKGYCRSNVDDLKCKKCPKAYVAVPGIGDRIKSSCGTIAKVYSITHYQEGLSSFDPIELNRLEPYIIIELGKI